jgi:selenide,water dikinase
VSTTDFFYPLIDDPYMMGRIGCANVLSDLYSAGIVDVDTMLMLLASSEEITDARVRALVTRLLMKGFADAAREAGTNVSGGQSVRNPWPIIGGVASAVVREEELVRPENAVPGDVVVLTKPLGTQPAVNAHQWYGRRSTCKQRATLAAEADKAVGWERVKAAYDKAAASMARLNRTGARLMHKHSAHAATDVTGFGLAGHATNLAKEQKASVTIEVDTLPVIRDTVALDEIGGYGLTLGFSSETSGGLLVCLPPDKAAPFCEEIAAIDNVPAWVIGRVVPRRPEGPFVLDDSPKIIEY